MEKKVDEALKQAVSNSNIDQKELDKRTLEIIKSALKNPQESFFHNIYLTLEEERKNERTKS